MNMKKSLFAIILLTLSSCGIFGNSSNNYVNQNEIHQNRVETAVKSYVLNTFNEFGLYQNFTFTNSRKQETIYHKRLNELYEAKYQLNKVGVLMGDSIRNINKETKCYRTFFLL